MLSSGVQSSSLVRSFSPQIRSSSFGSENSMEHKRQTQKESPVSSVISAAREAVIGFVQSISRTLSRSKENRDYTIAASNEDLS
jgi:hypothetical protein